MRVHCLQHVLFEDAANIAVWAGENGHVVSRTRLYEDAPLPNIEEIDLLAIMGGPMNVYQQRDYPWLRAEKVFVERVISAGVPVLGVCLGAQILADVLGARVTQNAHIEIGWFPVRRTAEAGAPVLFADMPAEFTAFHWHGDLFEIPRGALRLAESEACPNQAFEYAGHVLGLQFHIECAPDSIRRMLTHGAGELVDAPFVQDRRRILAGCDHCRSNQQLLWGLLDSMSRAAGCTRRPS